MLFIQIAKLTHSISVFTEGILMMKTTLVGIIKVRSESDLTVEAAWPSGGLVIRNPRVHVPPWPLVWFVFACPIANWLASYQLGFVTLLCSIWIICVIIPEKPLEGKVQLIDLIFMICDFLILNFYFNCFIAATWRCLIMFSTTNSSSEFCLEVTLYLSLKIWLTLFYV